VVSELDKGTIFAFELYKNLNSDNNFGIIEVESEEQGD
jgi:hypothetical protein